MSKHLIIPDVQDGPGAPKEHLGWVGHYIVDKKPNVIVQIGDFPEMDSLSTYEPKGSKRFEGRRYQKDVESCLEAQDALLKPLREYQLWTISSHKPRYEPRLVMTGGNHDDRITRAINLDPHTLEGTIGLGDLGFEAFGWEYIPFLQPVVIDGIAYCHYFISGEYERPISTARALLTKKHMSCVAGHKPGLDFASDQRADGSRLTSIIAGSYYQHDPVYRGPQANKHWRGIIVLHEVKDGWFDPMFVSLDYLQRKYG